LKVAAGDWLLLQANAPNPSPVARRQHFINGERVQVKAVQDGRITLADGRALPANYNTFTHGYAVTSHSSQGKTVDEVLLVASSKSFAAVNREQFYVSISRGRERVQIFTDDAELLGQRVTETHERKAAVELTELRQELAKLGFTRKAQETTLPVVAVRSDYRTVRRMRSPMANRLHRITRLPAVQRLAQVVEDVRRWVLAQGHYGQQEAIAETTIPKASVKSVEKILPANVTEKPRREMRPSIKPDVPPPRRSRGVGI
jgi:ATP-dependent exoDNAse (exonuclease V) alpha subunit